MSPAEGTRDPEQSASAAEQQGDSTICHPGGGRKLQASTFPGSDLQVAQTKALHGWHRPRLWKHTSLHAEYAHRCKAHLMQPHMCVHMGKHAFTCVDMYVSRAQPRVDRHASCNHTYVCTQIWPLQASAAATTTWTGLGHLSHPAPDHSGFVERAQEGLPGICPPTSVCSPSCLPRVRGGRATAASPGQALRQHKGALWGSQEGRGRGQQLPHVGEVTVAYF